jgi:hypothetical protein
MPGLISTEGVHSSISNDEDGWLDTQMLCSVHIFDWAIWWTSLHPLDKQKTQEALICSQTCCSSKSMMSTTCWCKDLMNAEGPAQSSVHNPTNRELRRRWGY